MGKSPSNIPGFRTGVLWKKVLSVIGHSVLLIVLIVILTYQQVDISPNDESVSKIEALLSFIGIVVVPYILLTNLFGLRDKLPLFRRRTILGYLLGMIVFAIATFIALGVGFSITTNYHSQEYKIALAKTQAENTLRKKNKKITKALEEEAEKPVESSLEIADTQGSELEANVESKQSKANDPVLISADAEKSVSTADNIKYRVEKKEDISTGIVKRYRWEVVIESQVTSEQIKTIAQKVVEEAKMSGEFNALVLGFYDYPEFIGYGYVLGKVEYAPDGDWSKASSVSAGQYDKMDYKYELYEKDWTKQLSKDEVKIFESWNKLYESKVTPTIIPDENQIDKEIAQLYSLQAEEVNQIVMKQIKWTFEGQ